MWLIFTNCLNRVLGQKIKWKQSGGRYANRVVAVCKNAMSKKVG